MCRKGLTLCYSKIISNKAIHVFINIITTTASVRVEIMMMMMMMMTTSVII